MLSRLIDGFSDTASWIEKQQDKVSSYTLLNYTKYYLLFIIISPTIFYLFSLLLLFLACVFVNDVLLSFSLEEFMSILNFRFIFEYSMVCLSIFIFSNILAIFLFIFSRLLNISKLLKKKHSFRYFHWGTTSWAVLITMALMLMFSVYLGFHIFLSLILMFGKIIEVILS